MDFFNHSYATITITDSKVYSRGVTLNVSLFFFVFSLGQIFLPLLGSPSFLPLSPFYNFNPCSYHYSYSIPIKSLRDISPLLYQFLPPSYLGILTTQGLRVLFRLSYAQLMHQRSSKTPS